MVGEIPSAADPGPEDRKRKSMRLAEVVPPAPTQDRGEVFQEPGAVVVTFHLPELEPDDLGYHVGTRTLSLWSRRNGVEFRTIMVLPTWVNPGQFVVSHKNGVFEFVLEPHTPTPALPAPEPA